MDIKQLEVFVNVVETCSFSKAGKLLHLTQPTVSASIASLERELDIKLIARTTKETFPTTAGKLLYRHAKDILEIRRKAMDELQSFSHEMRGSITIAASTIPGQYFLPHLIQVFREKYPDIKFDILMMDSEEVAGNIASRTAEIGFTGTIIPNSKCTYKEFALDRLVVITPNQPRFQQYQATGFPAKQILAEPFINREVGSGTRKEMESFLKEMAIDPAQLQTVVEVRSAESVKKLVSEGVGIAIVSQSACEDYCQFKKVLAFDFNNIAFYRKLYLLKHKSSILSPIARFFYDYAKDFYMTENGADHISLV